jgi:CDP-glucose 4,6-dehydratase
VENVVSADWDRAVYAGKTVLVTGHTGFKGSWLCHWLKRLGARVVGFALPPPPPPNLFEPAKVALGMTSIIGDVRDLSAVSAVVAEHRPDIVFHLAAEALVRKAYREPVETYATNVMGTIHVLEACRKSQSVRAIVIVTSDKCYENREWVWGYREDEPMGGFDPYSSSKACAELVTSAYRRSFFSDGAGAAVASARAGNVIGSGDWAEDRLVPDIIRGVAAGTPIVIRNPRSIRPWQHVLDPLSGYLQLAMKLWEAPREFAEAWNFGPAFDDPVPVIELAQRIIAVLEKGELEVLQLSPGGGPHEAHALKLDCSKARARLGFRPRLALTDALDWTARGYRALLDDPASAASVLDRQIDEYQSRSG